MRAPPDLQDRVTRPDDSVGRVWPLALTAGWQCVTTPAGACATPADCPDGGWLVAQVPGTVASAWRAAGRLDPAHPPRFAYDDHWYRLTLSGHGHRRLRLHGLASITEVWLDATLVLRSDSMFEAHDIDVELDGTATLALCFRSLTPALEARRTRARWRPRLVSPPTLRNVRTTLLGHMPGWCPPLQAAGPWRPVELLGGTPHAFDTVDLASRLEGSDGIVSLTLSFIDEQIPAPAAHLTCGGVDAALTWRDTRTLTGSLRIPDVERWWPHTHGVARLHDVSLRLGDAPAPIELGRIGFRTVEVDHGADGEGFGLVINGVPVFCRGACWTSADLVTLTGSPAQLEHAFALARDAGMNMLRVGGTMVYESDAFYALADRFGILIWQDFAFANFDYPTDDSFTGQTTREASQFLARTRRHASLAVLCGGSEVEQQAAMFGLPPAMRAQPLFTERLPALVAALRPDVPYVVNSPSGGTWPFSTRRGVTHYYGVGAYMRPLDDARRAQVRFAAECLAFANVPDDATLNDATGTIHQHDPRWKAAVPRDPGAGWDFDDVRDHYLHTLYGVEPARLRYEDPQRYLDLSRAVLAEVMTDVFSEWRRHGASCRGALVWQFQDLRAGAGWGLVDATGRPKSVWHALARTLQPVQLLITDEGLDGLDLHLINETDTAIAAQLEIVSLRDGVQKVASASVAVTLPARGTQCLRASDCLGQFFDFTYAYRFGPRSHDVTIATLRDVSDARVLSEAFHLPDRGVQNRCEVPVDVALEPVGQGWQLVVMAHRFARAVHVVDPHFRAAHDVFHLAPNRPQTIPLIRLDASDTTSRPQGELRAINALGPVFYG